MSIEKNYYVIAGFDLTKYKTDKFDDWKWEDDGEKFTSYQRNGNIQLFDDPMSGSHLYLGYILGSGDEYEFRTVKTDTVEIESRYVEVKNTLNYLNHIGVINVELSDIEYKVIVFEECY